MTAFADDGNEPEVAIEEPEADDHWVGLRYYQAAACAAVLEAFEEHRGALIVMATGLGKTQVFAALARYWVTTGKGDVLVLAHRKELIAQARARLEAMSGLRVGVEMAEQRSHPSDRIVVGSIDSVRQQRRLDMLGRDRFTLVIVDESHHAVSPSYKRVLTYFGGKLLGVTATADRGDGVALGQMFDTVAYSMDILDGINQGWLVPLVAYTVQVDELDISEVTTSAGDLAVGQLDEAMVKAVEPVVRGVLKHGEDRQGLIFFPGVRSAELAAARLNALEPDCARFACGDRSVTSDEERETIVNDFRAGKFRLLCNCMLFTEGFDAPPASLVALARPTKSRALMAQMVGRGTRALPGIPDQYAGEDEAEKRQAAIDWSSKQNTLVLDFVGNSGKHSLVTPIDALAGTYTEKEIARAKKKQLAGDDVQETLRAARAELAAIAKALKAKAKTSASEYNPFEVLHLDAAAAEAFDETYGRTPATPAQAWMARSRGFTNADLNGLTKHAVGKLITADKARESHGLATYAQMRALSRFGIADKGLRADAAAEAIDHAQARWKFPSSITKADLEAIVRRKR